MIIRAPAMVGQFREFLLKHNALALAVGVIIGASVGKVVTGIVDDLVMPIVGVLLPGGDWRLAQLELGSSGNALKYGDLLGRIVDFVIVALVVFLGVRLFLREPPKPVPATKSCPHCLENIPAAATRCRACTSQV